MLDVIRLSAMELRVCRAQAQARMDKDRAVIRDRKMGDQSGEFTDTEGLAAELAFCRWLGVYPVWQLAEQDAPDNGADVTINGWAIDVKATKYPNGRLLAAQHKRGGADMFVLVTGQDGTYRPVGWCTAGDLLRHENLTDLGHGKTYAMEQNRLRAMPELRQALRERKYQDGR